MGGKRMGRRLNLCKMSLFFCSRPGPSGHPNHFFPICCCCRRFFKFIILFKTHEMSWETTQPLQHNPLAMDQTNPGLSSPGGVESRHVRPWNFALGLALRDALQTEGQHRSTAPAASEFLKIRLEWHHDTWMFPNEFLETMSWDFWNMTPFAFLFLNRAVCSMTQFRDWKKFQETAATMLTPLPSTWSNQLLGKGGFYDF